MADGRSLQVIALVTAYNEAATIGAVLDALNAADSIEVMQVVDDGSSDATAEIAEERGARVIRLKQRVPVGEAIMQHLPNVEQDCLLLWCDADLTGLTPTMINRLVERYRQGDVTQVMSSRAIPPSWPGWLQRSAAMRWVWMQMFGPISGERVIRRGDFLAAIDLSRKLGWDEMMTGYGIVLFLNWYGQVFGAGKKIIYCDGLRQRQKYQKWGAEKGWAALGEMVRQWAQFARCWLKIRLQARRIKQVKQAEETRA